MLAFLAALLCHVHGVSAVNAGHFITNDRTRYVPHDDSPTWIPLHMLRQVGWSGHINLREDSNGNGGGKISLVFSGQRIGIDGARKKIDIVPSVNSVEAIVADHDRRREMTAFWHDYQACRVPLFRLEGPQESGEIKLLSGFGFLSPNIQADQPRRTLASVLPGELCKLLRWTVKLGPSDSIKGENGPAVFARDFVRGISLLDVSQQKNDADQRYGGLNHGDYQQPPSPIRHLPLGIQIALGALLVMSGAYGFFYAAGGCSRRPMLAEAVAHALLSGALILSGIAICFSVIGTS